MIDVIIVSASAQWKNAFPRMKKKIEIAATAAYDAAKKPAAFKRKKLEVTLLLTTDAEIKKLNRDWRGMDKPTNVLSFPQFEMKAREAVESGMSLGDVVLALQTIKRESRDQKKSLENHTIHLVTHGVLHLLGYDHIREKDAKTMEKLEIDILAGLGYPDPYNEQPQPQTGRKSRHGRHA